MEEDYCDGCKQVCEIKHGVREKTCNIFAFGVYNSKQVNVSCIQIFRAQFLRKVMLNAANIYLFVIKHTKCKYIYRSF